MHGSPLPRAVGMTALSLGLVLAATGPVAADSPTGGPSPDQMAAMRSAFGLTESGVTELIAAQEAAAETERELREELGPDFGGAVFDVDTLDLTVQVTDRSDFGAVRAAGAVPELVDHGESALDSVMEALDAAADGAHATVHGWYADPARDTVVIEAAPGHESAAEELAASAGVDADAVVVEESPGTPRTYADIVGGNPYYFQDGGSWYVCSIGFGVVGGYVTAGHCGDEGSDTWHDVPGTQQIGTVAGSVFPRSDMAWVDVTNPDFTPTAQVNDYDGGTVTVTGSAEAPVGASVCRSGRTTGWQCGVIEAKDQTVRYPRGQHVHGLTRTTACAEGGDSGGSWLAGTEAQGVTSGGSGDCTSGGTTYFQPLNPILERWNLTLLTG
ncbi:S1 family peptidase [Nocardiopsis sp. EMB25]|uniref:S1 family peptidase n=1 Tax=Nocardiopsis TaxID=2013 RepID=UPI001268B055|nr:MULTISPECIES: S1 family peptidase [Nocardiopsis]MCY9785946.1 S1 family peptidase [Nocardiopsis sp. EMB25]